MVHPHFPMRHGYERLSADWQLKQTSCLGEKIGVMLTGGEAQDAPDDVRRSARTRKEVATPLEAPRARAQRAAYLYLDGTFESAEKHGVIRPSLAVSLAPAAHS